MNVEHQVIEILLSALAPAGTAAVVLQADTALLGHVPELDSMTVVSILTALEQRFGITIDDDEVDGRTFESVASLVDFVKSKLEQ